MFTETLSAHDDVIGIACDGTLSRSDLGRMHALLHDRLDRSGKVGLVLDLTGFEGYEGSAAVLEDLRIDTAHANDFSRVAIVGAGRLLEWGMELAGALSSAEMRGFDTAEMAAAVAWARGI